MTVQNKLQESLECLDFMLVQAKQDQLIQHLQLLIKWNKTHNLTAICGIENMLVLHVLDSLSVAKYLQGDRFLDLGSGAGFPGIPLAIALPTKEFVLLEKNRKKSTFIQHVVNELNLTNVTVVQSRIESFSPNESFDGLLARAVGETDWIYSKGLRLLHSDKGKFYLMSARKVIIPPLLKGKAKVVNLDVPNLDATRKLLIIEV
ncbi:MAG: 16S rRNA (guanine(527)-N(7))-methyltransferase RsmG [Legionellales bacterium]|nr:16S rRNA (guanine(527)-N(7))-methyltransferase RsmG [Legionellales bacterium]